VTTQITLIPSFKNGYRYKVIHQGHTLIEDTSNPEYDACRALLAKGITGQLVTYRGETPCMVLDIEKGAEITILETSTSGPRKVKYRPWQSPCDLASLAPPGCWSGPQNSDSRVAVGGNFPRSGLEGTPHACNADCPG